jgi:hypothetical protein
MRAAQRRRIYISSLEAHIDKLHNQLIGIGLYPVPYSSLAPYKGMSTTAAKAMLAGLQQDAQHISMKETEIERAVSNIYCCLSPIRAHAGRLQNLNLRRTLETVDRERLGHVAVRLRSNVERQAVSSCLADK